MHKYQKFSVATDHGVLGSNKSGAPFVHLQMGDAKDRSPKNLLSVICIWKWEMQKSTHRWSSRVSLRVGQRLKIHHTHFALIAMLDKQQGKATR